MFLKGARARAAREVKEVTLVLGVLIFKHLHGLTGFQNALTWSAEWCVCSSREENGYLPSLLKGGGGGWGVVHGFMKSQRLGIKCLNI